MFDAAKPWYLSRTIWASLVTVLVGLGGLVGLPLSEEDGVVLTELLVQGVTAVAGLVALFGRLRATRRIG